MVSKWLTWNVFRISLSVKFSNGFTIKSSYLKAISDAYKASAQNIDISNQAEAAEVMNEFVKTTTKGKIAEIIKKDSISRKVSWSFIRISKSEG